VRIPDFLQELRPHLLFWILEKAFGALVIAAFLALVEQFKHHLDITTIAAVFGCSLGLMLWIDRKRGSSHRTEVEGALDRQPLADAPDVRMSYIAGDRRSKLIFENKRQNTTATIRAIHPLTSQAFYEGVYPLTLLKSTFPPLDFGGSVECEISAVGDGPSLEAVMEQGGPDVSDWVVIDYDSNGHEFSRCFTLYKNSDGSIVWTPGTIERRGGATGQHPQKQDIISLRQKLSLAVAFPREKAAAQLHARELQEEREKLRRAFDRKPAYLRAGAAQLLARQAYGLHLRLVDLVNSYTPLPEELKFPLSEFAAQLPEDGWTGCQRHAWRFQKEFYAHRSEVQFQLIDFKSEITEMRFPNHTHADMLILALDSHHTALVDQAASLSEDRERSATSASDQT
jgi:hypothetical protein